MVKSTCPFRTLSPIFVAIAGGIGIGFSRVRSRGALIRGTNGLSNPLLAIVWATLQRDLPALLAQLPLVRQRLDAERILLVERGQ